MFTHLGSFLNQLWDAIGAALRLDPDLLPRVAASPDGKLLVIVLAVLAGSSMLAGQSVILFANRVMPGRFVFSLGFYGLMFALSVAVWGASFWLSAVALFRADQPLGTAMQIAGLGCAPLLFGFLTALPYLGSPIEWALRVWSLLIMLALARAGFGYTTWQALACSLLGWLLIQVGTRLLGRPLAALRDWLWRAATGTHFDTNEDQLVAAATAALREQLARL